MKTSLVCLLLLAAVACAAPNAGMARKARKMRTMAEEAKVKQGRADEVAVAGGADLEAVGEGEGDERFLLGCFGPCFSPFGEIGCLFDGCYSPIDVLYYRGICACCAVASVFQCF